MINQIYKIVFIIFAVTIVSLSTNVNPVHADKTCDQAGEICCYVGNLRTCDGQNLACNKEENPNDDPDNINDAFIFICRDKSVVEDTTKCDQVGDKCCALNLSTTIPFCISNLKCDQKKDFTCQKNVDNLDYSKCSLNGNSCCNTTMPGSGILGSDYCGPGLTMQKTSTSCKCCTPGDDDCDPNSNTIPTFKLCQPVKGNLNTECTNCLDDGGVWSALGCIKFDPKDFITDFLKLAMGIAGGIALLLMIYGSFLISTSAGDPKKSEEGKEIITGTIAGLLFIIFSVILLRVIGVDILKIPGF